MVTGEAHPDRHRACIYIGKPDWKEFLKICKREGKSASDRVDEFVKMYVQQHKAGNPQLLMSHYVMPEEATPMRVLCRRLAGALSDGRIFCEKAEMWIKSIQCYSCKDNRLRRKLSLERDGLK